MASIEYEGGEEAKERGVDGGGREWRTVSKAERMAVTVVVMAWRELSAAERAAVYGMVAYRTAAGTTAAEGRWRSRRRGEGGEGAERGVLVTNVMETKAHGGQRGGDGMV